MAPGEKALCELAFVDLYLGPDYADVKGMPGAQAPRITLPAEYESDIVALRDECNARFAGARHPEFSLVKDDVLYRVTVMNNLHAQPVYFLRRMSATIREFDRLGLSRPFVGWIMQPQRPGLILIAGETSTGKTSTAASLLAARLRAHGGLALAIEDPPETTLDGLHGEGRCIQIPVLDGNYREQLRRAMRTGVGTLLIGEIRDGDTATEALKHAGNGLCVIATVHAKGVPDALARVLSLIPSGEMKNPADLLAAGLTAAIHQRLERAPSEGGTVVRPLFKTLALAEQDAPGIRSKIRDDKLFQLMQDVENQSRRTVWT